MSAIDERILRILRRGGRITHQALAEWVQAVLCFPIWLMNSSLVSSVVAGAHEQSCIPRLQDRELTGL